MLRHLIACGTVVGGLWANLAIGEVPAREPRSVARAIERLPLSIEQQWQRVTAIIQSALERISRIANLQAAAARQIDAADYALSQLLDDLRTAMPLPADVAALRAILAEAERTAPVRRARVATAMAA